MSDLIVDDLWCVVNEPAPRKPRSGKVAVAEFREWGLENLRILLACPEPNCDGGVFVTNHPTPGDGYKHQACDGSGLDLDKVEKRPIQDAGDATGYAVVILIGGNDD